MSRVGKRLRRIMSRRAISSQQDAEPCASGLAPRQDVDQELFPSVARLLCALSQAWVRNLDSDANAASARERERHALHDEEALHDPGLAEGTGALGSEGSGADGPWASGALMPAALREWHSFLDEVFPSLLDWAGPHQPASLRRLAFGVVASVVRDVPLDTNPEAADSLGRYCFPMLPLLNASLSGPASTPCDPRAAAAAAAAPRQEARLVEYRSLHEHRSIRSATRQMLQNGVYCLGILAEQGGQSVALEALKLRFLLLALLNLSAEVGDVVHDNAVDALLPPFPHPFRERAKSEHAANVSPAKTYVLRTRSMLLSNTKGIDSLPLRTGGGAGTHSRSLLAGRPARHDDYNGRPSVG